MKEKTAVANEDENLTSSEKVYTYRRFHEIYEGIEEDILNNKSSYFTDNSINYIIVIEFCYKGCPVVASFHIENKDYSYSKVDTQSEYIEELEFFDIISLLKWLKIEGYKVKIGSKQLTMF